jgi:hypothetical protein
MVKVAANTGNNSRSGGVTISGAVYEVVQAGSVPPLPQCAYAFAPPSRTVAERGGTRDVQLLTTSHCPWQASSNATWISLLGKTSGTGSTILRYQVARNRSDDSRVGTIVIGGEVHTVRQDGD